jgi:hypothetical protein
VIADSLSDRDKDRVMASGGPIALEAYRGEDVADGEIPESAVTP